METVDNTLDILEVFLNHEGELGISEISSLSGINISTSYRITLDLVKRGYLRQKQKRGKYAIGMKLLEFNVPIQRALKVGDIVQSYLDKLSKETGEYAEVAVLNINSAVTIAQAEVAHNLRIVNIIGERLPLESTAVGKILLANMSLIDRNSYYVNRTIKDIEKIDHEINNIKRQGYAIDNEEYGAGIWSVAAPIYDFTKSVIAAVGIAAPSARIDKENRQKFISLIVDYSREISKNMGYTLNK